MAKKTITEEHDVIICRAVFNNQTNLRLAFIEASCTFSLLGMRPITIAGVTVRWYTHTRHIYKVFGNNYQGQYLVNTKNSIR